MEGSVSYHDRSDCGKSHPYPLLIVHSSNMTTPGSPATVANGPLGIKEERQTEVFEEASGYSIGKRSIGAFRRFAGKSHMNPEAAPFIPSYQGRRREQQEHKPAQSQQEFQFPSANFFPPQSPFPPSVYNSPSPFPQSNPPFFYQPYSPAFYPTYPSYIPWFRHPLPNSVSQSFCYQPCCYSPMASSQGNNYGNKHWAYAPPPQGNHGRGMDRPAPGQGPFHQSANGHARQPSIANPTQNNQFRGFQPTAPPARNNQVNQNNPFQRDNRQHSTSNNASRGPVAPQHQEYRGPLIVPPSLRQSQTSNRNTHFATNERLERVDEGLQHQATVASLSHQLAAVNLTNNNADVFNQVKSISVTNNIITVQGMPFEIPIDDGTRYSSPATGGVLKLMNIPYNVSRQEVVHLMGRKARLLPHHLGTPVHIIMDRSTAKTMDCYVEFLTLEDAKETIDWLNRGLPGAPPRLGDRHIDIEMSSQEELLKDLFPRAKCIVWKEGRPILTPNNDAYSVGFQSFLTAEEIYCMIRNAEMPKRAPFATKCPQRTYEALISTLYKFPWYATTLYTVEDRNRLHFACFSQLQALAPRVAEKRTLGLDSRLILDLLNAGLSCPTFTDRQKVALYSAAGDPNTYNTSPVSIRFWPFDTLARKANVTEETVNKFARVVAASLERKKPGTEILANKWVPRPGVASPFGQIWLEFASGHTHLKWDVAVQYETKVLQGLVEEGLKATRAGPFPWGNGRVAPGRQIRVP
ncbi:predicted protein [Uncinocarpus reesii 1704]|uniref:Uncharacterized protein n=1 Tax=Uncinocarpus reesii (strain UAMH 1704) TaxID=336963 RepID=C4JPA5_UNCRE|nr:uncharacterized protein UREG_04487 [Uncinocarpus reesii 1704]EEP79641.1 predicted protein [Uncinocarpus reesii 1704]